MEVRKRRKLSTLIPNGPPSGNICIFSGGLHQIDLTTGHSFSFFLRGSQENGGKETEEIEHLDPQWTSYRKYLFFFFFSRGRNQIDLTTGHCFSFFLRGSQENGGKEPEEIEHLDQIEHLDPQWTSYRKYLYFFSGGCNQIDLTTKHSFSFFLRGSQENGGKETEEIEYLDPQWTSYWTYLYDIFVFLCRGLKKVDYWT